MTTYYLILTAIVGSSANVSTSMGELNLLEDCKSAGELWVKTIKEQRPEFNDSYFLCVPSRYRL